METVKAVKKMRDPAGNTSRYANLIAGKLSSEEATRATPESPQQEVMFRSYDIATFKDIVLYKYCMGDDIGSIKADILSRSVQMASGSEFVRANGEGRYASQYAVDGTTRVDVAFSGLGLLLVDDPHYLDVFRRLLSPAIAERSCLMDVLIKAFVPEHAVAPKYKADKWVSPWAEPVLRVLAGPEEARAEGLAACMKNWCRVMRQWGWKPNLDTAIGKDLLFSDFAFEVALAACAYDIDDSAFNDHPYYPRDLVDHYRENVRHTRDAWRAAGMGAGVPVAPPPAPRKADLGKSRRKAVARWVELVCDGNVEATEAVLETIGKPRELDDIDELMSALSEQRQAIHADVKDDETTLIAAATLAAERGLGEFNGPPGPPFGPARCSAGLLAFADWLGTRGYRLIDLDNQDDAWHAVVVRAEYHDELLELSNGLKIVAREPSAACND